MAKGKYRALARAALALVAAMLALPAIAQSTDSWKCTSVRPNIPLDERISSCNAVIAAEKDSWLYKSRAYSARGKAYFEKDEFDSAIADFTEVIKLYPDNSYARLSRAHAFYKVFDFDRAVDDADRAVQLEPASARAYLLRGWVYYGKGDLDRALSDDEQALRLAPKLGNAFQLRAAIHRTKGAVDRAIADHDRLIELEPKNARAYHIRGVAHFQAGALSKSLTDFDRASELDRKYAYAALWRDVVAKRSNLPSRLAEAVGDLDMSKWPAPIIHLFLGESSPEALFAAADDSNGARKRAQICEANFYTGAWLRQRGERERARLLFQLAATECPQSFVERQAANAELKEISR